MTGRAGRLWREWRLFIAFIVVMLVFRSAIADWNQVPSGSMLPSILIGDRIVVNKLAYDLRVPFTLQRLAHWSTPQRGDVVTFTSPEDDRLLVKRVVALPGDVVELHQNRLTINGMTASYSPVDDAEQRSLPFQPRPGYRLYHENLFGRQHLVMLRADGRAGFAGSFPATTVPEGKYLMLGDNRDNSRDSRVIGFIDRDRILGRATTVAFSLDYDHYYAPRMGRFLADLP
ncbi:MAG: signal peptidase I [Pseudomonadales bacterium]